MTPEDEEKIDALLPEIKTAMKDYTGFTDKDLKDALWFNYLEVEPTLKELKSE